MKVANTTIKNILVIRFSAMGDVVLSRVVLQNLLQKYPDVHITLLTKPFFHPFFQDLPNVTLYPVDIKGKHKGILGLRKLVKELTKYKSYDVVIDLHSVIRTWMIDFFFKLKGVPVYKIDKGRKEKKAFVGKKVRKKLPHSTERYHKVFLDAGFDFPLNKQVFSLSKISDFDTTVIIDENKINIGIAPFAAHKSKQWGIKKIIELIERINAQYKVNFYLFGGGTKEVMQLNEIADAFQNVTNLAGKYTLKQELDLIKSLSVLISMDSGNMHIASLLEIPIISIWGGTHPDIGFSALYQPKVNSIQIPIDELPCRPCSVFGTSECIRKEEPFACMNRIEVDAVINRLVEIKVLKLKVTA